MALEAQDNKADSDGLLKIKMKKNSNRIHGIFFVDIHCTHGRNYGI